MKHMRRTADSKCDLMLLSDFNGIILMTVGYRLAQPLDELKSKRVSTLLKSTPAFSFDLVIENIRRNDTLRC